MSSILEAHTPVHKDELLPAALWLPVMLLEGKSNLIASADNLQKKVVKNCGYGLAFSGWASSSFGALIVSLFKSGLLSLVRQMALKPQFDFQILPFLRGSDSKSLLS